MPHRALVVALALLALPAAAQNFVTNGDFSAGIAGWTESGYSYQPGIETFDTTGLGASQCYGCGPGGQFSPPPYPPNSIDQTVTIIPGIPYEISADLSTTHLHPTSANADAGTIYVEIGGVEVARTVMTLGNIPALATWRGRLCARFTSASAGPTALSVKFIRAYLGANVTPRMRIDNISLQLALGPTFCIQAPQRIGTLTSMTVAGPANAPYAVFIAAKQLANGVQFPGIRGLWFLDFATTATLMGGTLDANGQAATTIAIPADPNLTQAGTYFQSAEIFGGVVSLGFAFGAVFTT